MWCGFGTLRIYHCNLRLRMHFSLNFACFFGCASQIDLEHIMRNSAEMFWSKTGGEFGQRRRSAGAAEGTELLQALFVQLSAAADAPLRPGVAFAPPPRVGFYVLESRAEPVTPAAASELHKNWVMSEVDDRTGASAGCAEVDGEVRERLKEVAEAEVLVLVYSLHAMCLVEDRRRIRPAVAA